MYLILTLVALSLSKYTEIVRFPVELPTLKAPLPHHYTAKDDLPKNWNWANINGTSFITKGLNQHIP